MAQKINTIAALAKESAKDVVQNRQAWTSFLETAARLYKYPFKDQLLIYAQRPNASACATIETWNEKMFCWVNKGAKGIALIDDDAPIPKLKYVFDIQDVHKARQIGKDPNIWQLHGDAKEAVIQALEKTYGHTNTTIGFEERLVDIARIIVKDCYEDLVEDLVYLVQDSYMEEMDRHSITVAFRENLFSSVAYMLLSRCGIDMDGHSNQFHFHQIYQFNTIETLSYMGNTISEIAKPILVEIGKAIAGIEKEKIRDKNVLDKTPNMHYNALKRESEMQSQNLEKEEERGNEHDELNLSTTRGIHDTGSEDGRIFRERNKEIWSDAERIPESEQSRSIHRTNLEEPIAQPSDGSTDSGRGQDGANYPADDIESGRDRSVEGRKSDAVGTEDEQHISISGGDYSNGDHLQLTLFPNIQQQIEAIEIGARHTAPFFELQNTDQPQAKYSYLHPKQELEVPYPYILNVLRRGTGSVNGKNRIDQIYKEPITTAERVKRIRQEFGQGGAGWPIEGLGLHGYDTFSSKGLRFQWKDLEGEKEGHVSWNQVEKTISDLILSNRYHEDTLGQDVPRVEIADEHALEVGEPEVPEAKEVQVSNYQITDDSLGQGSIREKFRKNVEAIGILKNIEEERRTATPKEQNHLAQYVGWGGLSQAFDEVNTAWSKEYQELKTLLSKEEYISARESTLNAHYTSPVIIRAMYDMLETMGFESGNILEPAAGTGNFFGMLPEKMNDSKLYGVELDDLTGRIAKQLYPQANIKIMGFEKTDYPNDFFDAAIGNVPFGQYKVSDRTYDKHNFLIHDYFFAKALDKIRPGGVMAFITSKGTMDKVNPSFRKYLAQRAELVGAVRLPNDAFLANAGTEVTADILVFMKRDRVMNIEPEWVHLGEDSNGIIMNQYFINHPEMIVGQMEMVSGPYGMESTCSPILERGSFSEQLMQALGKITGQYVPVELEESEINTERAVIPADPNVKNYSYTIVDQVLYYRENSIMKPSDVSEGMAERIMGMVSVRDATQELIRVQLEEYGEEVILNNQKELNALYDAFSKKFGLINSQSNKRAFSQDSSYCLLCSLEKLNEDGTLKDKADMFFKRTIKKQVVVTSVDTAIEGLAVSLSEKAKVDISFIAELSGKSNEKVIQELQGVIFRNPITKDWETADAYLSGSVRNKLETARAFAERQPEYIINVKSLEQVQPKLLEASEIEIRLGATWIDKNYINDFMKDVLKTPRYMIQRDVIGVQYSSVTGLWNIQGKNADYGNSIANMTLGTNRANAYKLLEDALNLRDTRIFDIVEEDGKEKRVLNKKETMLASQKQEAIREEFKDWIFRDSERREVLCTKYNEIFNASRPREYDGTHLNFPGMSPEITLKPHQKNAVAHVLYGENTLLAHCVGAGKTFEMVASAMESKRLGLCQKSLFVVPNHLTEQWSSDFLRLYPGANILAATKKDFEPANRKKFCSRIATGEYDAVIIGHSQFEKIPLSIERQRTIIENQINEISTEIACAKANNGERYSIKQMEKTKKSLATRLDKLNDQSRKDDVVSFEQLGVDRLFVDESHGYKNLFLYTKMRNVAGIAQTEAQKSSDMFAKCRYMDELTGGKGITFATGTPISNSMTELYTNMRYLQFDKLQQLGLGHFDSWAASFGETVTAIELAPEGTGYRAKTRFAKFFNLPELIGLFKESADIQTPDMLKLPIPEAIYHNEVIKPSEHQKEMVLSLAERAEAIRNHQVDAATDNMLKITNDGRKLALDQRLIQEILPDEENSKVNMCAENTHKIWKDSMDIKATQLIFCDLSTPKGDGSFSIYEDMKQKLISKGVPDKEIAFIHDANTEIRKAELFAKVRSGQVRVLMGSTAKMGAGTNVQDKLIALHHVDVPWRPSDIEQQEGRILRQGNENKKVDIFRYVTESTFDSYSWQLIENKQKFIGQIMTSKSPVRSCEDIDEAALSYAEVKALATGNPYIKEKMGLDNQVAKLKLMKANHTSQIYRLEDNIAKHYPLQICAIKERIVGLNKDMSLYASHKPADKDVFQMILGNNVFTDKKEAGSTLLARCKEVKTPSTFIRIGKYLGFDLQVKFDAFDMRYSIGLKGELNHQIEIGTDPMGNMSRLNHVLDGMEEQLRKNEELLENVQNQLENAKIEVVKPFAQDAELNEKLERLNALNALLNMDEKCETGLDLDNDETESELEGAATVRSDSPSKIKAISPEYKPSIKEKIQSLKESVKPTGNNMESMKSLKKQEVMI